MCVTATNVFSAGNRLHVIGVLASRVEAQMVDVEVIGYGATDLLIEPAMRDACLASTYPEVAVPAPDDLSRPVPAASALIEGDCIEESLEQCWAIRVGGSASTLKAGKVHQAERVYLCHAHTVFDAALADEGRPKPMLAHRMAAAHAIGGLRISAALNAAQLRRWGNALVVHGAHALRAMWPDNALAAVNDAGFVAHTFYCTTPVAQPLGGGL